MTDFFERHRVIARLGVIWAVSMVTAVMVFLFSHPDMPGASNVLIAVIGLFAVALLNWRKAKGIE